MFACPSPAKRPALTAACIALAFTPFKASAEMPDRLAEIAREFIVYIYYEVPGENGTSDMASGTGFVVSSRGYVLTTAHLFRKWNALPEETRRSVRNPRLSL